jgi:hypothetical protein
MFSISARSVRIGPGGRVLSVQDPMLADLAGDMESMLTDLREDQPNRNPTSPRSPLLGSMFPFGGPGMDPFGGGNVHMAGGGNIHMAGGGIFPRDPQAQVQVGNMQE